MLVKIGAVLSDAPFAFQAASWRGLSDVAYRLFWLGWLAGGILVAAIAMWLVWLVQLSLMRTQVAITVFGQYAQTLQGAAERAINLARADTGKSDDLEAALPVFRYLSQIGAFIDTGLMSADVACAYHHRLICMFWFVFDECLAMERVRRRTEVWHWQTEYLALLSMRHFMSRFSREAGLTFSNSDGASRTIARAMMEQMCEQVSKHLSTNGLPVRPPRLRRLFLTTILGR